MKTLLKLKNLLVVVLLLSSVSAFAVPQKRTNSDLVTVNPNVITKNKFINQNVDEKYYFKNTIHVKFKKDVNLKNVSNTMIEQLLGKNNLSVKIDRIETPFRKYLKDEFQSSDKYGISRITQIYFSNDIEPYQICAKLMENVDIEYATPVFKRELYEVFVNDPRLSQQYAINLLKLSQAWEITKGDTNVIIAIVDSGTDILHEDLKNNIKINWNEIPNNKVDDDKNGKIDDVNGWDFIGDITTQDYINGKFKEDNDPRNSGNGHGTHTAGCASAVTNNSIGIASPGYNCKLMPLKCAADNPQLGAGILRGYEAILFAAENGADVINCSWGGPGGSPAEQDIINTAVEKGAVVVVASGNSGQFIDLYPEYPAAYENVLCAGASATNDQIAGFTNYGNLVTVYAPGAQILSTYPGNNYTAQDGTSFSSPLTAGIVGLLKSIHPEWTPMQFIRQLRSTADQTLTGVTGFEYYFVGRANAYKALTYNNPAFPEMTLPGIFGENIKVENQINALNSFTESSISVDLKNYLGAAKNLSVKITPIDNFVRIISSDIQVAEINTMDSKNIKIQVELTKDCPWYQGFAQVLLTYESAGYKDYQVINVPINLETTNFFSLVRETSISSSILYYGGSMPNKENVWIVGNIEGYGSLLFRRASNSALSLISQEPVYCVHAFNFTEGLIGVSPTSGLAKFQFTKDGGQSWSTKMVDNITPFINTVYFYNTNEGIFLGDPKSNIWGIAKTQDGGQNWTLVPNVPVPLNGETGYVESYKILGNNIWFGTSQGRVFYSTDKGTTWNVSKTVLGNSLSKMDFMNDKTGFALYNVGSGQTAQTFMAVTTDGGVTWSIGIHDFSKSGIRPVAVHCVPDAEKVLIITNINRVYESDNNGATWSPVLTKRLDGVTYGIGLNDGVSVRLWSAAAAGVGYLDATLKATTERKEISSVTENPFNYGNINIGNSKIGKIEIKNTGNVDLNISTAAMQYPDGVDSTEFKLMSEPQNILKPSESTFINVAFRPKSKGKRTAYLIVNNDAKPNELKVELFGNGVDASSVAGSEDESVSVNPNPAKDHLNIKLEDKINSPVNIEIYDIQGNLLISSQNINPAGNIQLDINSLNSGSYLMKIYNTKYFNSRVFTVVK